VDALRVNATNMFDLDAGATVEMFAYQASGGNLDIDPYSETWFSGRRVGDVI
jgi:hypothetical protein